MFLSKWRYSNAFRIVVLLLLVEFLVSQNAYAAEQIQLNQETGEYQPIKPIADSFQADEDLNSSSININNQTLPLTNDFWNEGPLSSPTILPIGTDGGGSPPTVEVDETLVEMTSQDVIASPVRQKMDGSVLWRKGAKQSTGSEIASASLGPLPRNDGGYDFEFYSFQDTLELICPEFVVNRSKPRLISLKFIGNV